MALKIGDKVIYKGATLAQYNKEIRQGISAIPYLENKIGNIKEISNNLFYVEFNNGIIGCLKCELVLLEKKKTKLPSWL
jgi:hypothetical protein